MKKEYTHIAPKQIESTRIDKYLSMIFPELSRTKIAAAIDGDHLLVNEKKVKASYKVNPDDKIYLWIQEEAPLTAKPQDIPLTIVYEDEHVIIINKPAGLVVHPAVGNPDGTMVNALTYHFKSLSNLQGDLRPGTIHRLDKDTSGLLMVAKDDFTHSDLSKQLSEHTITRAYYGVCWGNLKEEHFTIEAPIGRNPNNRQKMAVIEGGRFARAHISVIEHFTFCDLVQCKLETGRTHQIRVHLSYCGHPVFGDEIYGGSKKHLKHIPDWHRQKALEILGSIQRQMLHAYLLGSIHPHTKKYLEFTAPIPEDMEKVLSALRNLI